MIREPNRKFRFVVVRESTLYGDSPTVVGRFENRKRADEYAWRCAIRYTLPDAELSYAVYPIAWEVRREPS